MRVYDGFVPAVLSANPALFVKNVPVPRFILFDHQGTAAKIVYGSIIKQYNIVNATPFTKTFDMPSLCFFHTKGVPARNGRKRQNALA